MSDLYLEDLREFFVAIEKNFVAERFDDCVEDLEHLLKTIKKMDPNDESFVFKPGMQFDDEPDFDNDGD